MMTQVIVNGHLTFFWDAVPLVLPVLLPRSQGLPVS